MSEICSLCPRECGADRQAGAYGICGVSGEKIKIARAALHRWEEPCISGDTGSGAVFFCGCPLKCVYCQNREIAHAKTGIEVSVNRLAKIFLNLQQQGAANINLVTPTHYTPQIVEAADRYSRAPDYPDAAKAALEEMVRQAGSPVFDEQGMLMRGVIVRHLLLPSCVRNGKAVVKYVHETYGDQVLLSLMNQYTPMESGTAIYPELGRKVTKKEYEKLVDYALNLGVGQGYIQEGDTAKESFIPDFDGTGIIK